jgi:NitT/TauT family transport system substrate-binding protein
MRMKHFVRRLVALTVTVFAAVLVAGGAAAEGTKVKVGYNQWIGFAQAYVAKDKGIFARHGLDVELVAFPGPGDSLPPLIAGHLDLTLSCPDNVVLLHGTESDAVVSVFQIDTSAGADGIVAKKSIASAKDLKGKKVAATVGQVNHLLMLMALQNAGLTEQDVELVNMNADDAGAAFIAGTLDAAATWEPWLSKAAAADGHVLFSSKDAPGILGDCVVATRAATQSKADTIRKFLAAMDEGVQFLKSNPDESMAVTAKYLGVKPEEAKEMLTKVRIFSLEDNKQLLGTPEKPGPQYAAMKKVGDFMAAHGVTKKNPDPANMIDSRFVNGSK